MSGIVVMSPRRKRPVSHQSAAASLLLLVLGGIATPALAQFGSVSSDHDSNSRRNFGGQVSASTRSEAAGQLLREGTRIGPTVGRIVRSRSRWQFRPRESSPVTKMEADANQAAELTRRAYRGQDQDWLAKPPANSGSPPNSDIPIGTLGRSEDDHGAALPRMLIVENLMLQRIAHAIDIDSRDDRWQVEGHVTEFDSENRLIITTARRAKSSR